MDGDRGLIILLPGSWMRSSVWSGWRTLFDRNGYDSEVSTWPTAGVSLKTLVDNATALTQARTLTEAATTPILIGHGIGAVIAQVVVGASPVVGAAIAIAPPVAGWVSRGAPLRHCHTRLHLGAAPLTSARRLTASAFARGYANTVTPVEALDLCHRFVVPSSTKPVFQASFAWREPMTTSPRPHRPPVLLLSGGRDRLCPESGTRSWERFGRRRYPSDVTDHHVFPDRGHSLTIDGGWENVANFCLDWLTTQNL